MRLLHTSDWHLGRRLYNRPRYREHEQFLDWLLQILNEQQVDLLLVAGDIFDTSTPSNRAQELYYRFLARAADSSCRHLVITGGNHDSPSFLDAPKALLKALRVHVIGSSDTPPDQQVLSLADDNGETEAIVCAVPYLRDRDIRQSSAAETSQQKAQNLVEGIARHYREVFEIARHRRAESACSVPLIGMGHLFAAGGQVSEGDGVRELYVGSLAHFPASGFPDGFDYLALGHLHQPQAVAGKPCWRYSGSPLAMSFGEAGQQKSVCLIDLTGSNRSEPQLLPVPVFQELRQICGDWQAIQTACDKLVESDSDAWLEIDYQGDELPGALKEKLQALLSSSRLQLLRITNRQRLTRLAGADEAPSPLDELSPQEVFEQCLQAHQVPVAEAGQLRQLFQQTLTRLHEADSQAE